MGVVQQAVADRVDQGRLAEVVVALGGRQLARDDGRVGAIAILQDLEEVAALRILDRRQPPVVDDRAGAAVAPPCGASTRGMGTAIAATGKSASRDAVPLRFIW